MEIFTEFIEVSTIHGLNFIASSKRCVRFVWILVVIGGFTGAGYLIQESFYNWNQRPISTSIETLPISDIIFPNISVCPINNFYTNINYDIMYADKIEINTNKRMELLNYAYSVVQNETFHEILRNLSKVYEKERYYNWYYGYTRIDFPFYKEPPSPSRRPSGFVYSKGHLNFSIWTSAKSGLISTQYYGDKFNSSKVEENIKIGITFVGTGENNTILVEAEKITIKEHSDRDKITASSSFEDLHVERRNFTSKITLGTDKKEFVLLDRDVSKEEILDVILELMPGFKLQWHSMTKVQSEPYYKSDFRTKEFVRYN